MAIMPIRLPKPGQNALLQNVNRGPVAKPTLTNKQGKTYQTSDLFNRFLQKAQATPPAPTETYTGPAAGDPAPPGSGVLGQVRQKLSTPMDFSALPEVTRQPVVESRMRPVDVSPAMRATVGAERIDTPALMTTAATPVDDADSFNPNTQYFRAGQLLNPVGTMQGYGDDVAAAERATFQRGSRMLSPVFDAQRRRIAQNLVNRGIPPGSEAYQREMDRFEQGQNRALENLALSSVGAGRAEHGRLSALARGLRSDEVMQDLARRGFDAREASREFGEGLAGARYRSGRRDARFGQQMAVDRFDADQAGQDFLRRMASQDQYFRHGLSADQFRANELRRVYDQQMGNQRLLGDADRFDAGRRDTRFGQDMALRGMARDEALLDRNLPLSDLENLLRVAGPVPGGPRSTGEMGTQGVGAPDHTGNVYANIGMAGNAYDRRQAGRANDWTNFMNALMLYGNRGGNN